MRSREQVIDEMLVLAAQDRQVEAFERLAARWHPRLLRHARRLTGDLEGAREVVQETWIAVARGLGRLSDPACFGAWALCIVSRRCADWIRQRQRARVKTAGLNAASEAAAPVDDRGDDRVRVREALCRLEPGQRLLVAMFYGESLSVIEIARILEIPAGTVKSRLFSAREQMRASLEVHDDTTIRR